MRFCRWFLSLLFRLSFLKGNASSALPAQRMEFHRMRKLILISLVAAVFLPPCLQMGAVEPAPLQKITKITVDQLQQLLADGASDHRLEGDSTQQIGSDTSLLRQIGLDSIVAPQIDAVELSERLTTGTLARLNKKFPFGPETQRALELLADRSAFLDPPASELPAIAAPDEDYQKLMLKEARGFGLQVLLELPNFSATRTTVRFDNDPQALKGFAWTAGPGLHLAGVSTRQISFIDGRELAEPNPAQAASPVAVVAQPQGAIPALPPSLAVMPSSQFAQADSGLESHGEFGAELAIILTDTLNGTMTFHHWEQRGTGKLAVFHYAVPAPASHYEIHYTSVYKKKPFSASPGYHGSISIDPASGAILRVTLQADYAKTDPVNNIASVIEYGPVVLGDRRSLCPIRSLAFLTEVMPNRKSRNLNTVRPVSSLNRSIFSQYHRMASSFRLLDDAEVVPANKIPAKGAALPTSAATPPTPVTAAPAAIAAVPHQPAASPVAVAANRPAAPKPADADADDDDEGDAKPIKTAKATPSRPAEPKGPLAPRPDAALDPAADASAYAIVLQ
jgi:hypothetical protein